MAVLSWIHAVILFAGTYLPVADLMWKSQIECLLYMAHSLWLFIPVIAGWFLIRKIKSFPVYLMSTVGICAGVWLMTDCLQTLILCVLLFVIRILPRISKGNQLEDYPGEVEEFRHWEVPTILDRPGIFCWIAFVVLYFILIFMKSFHLLVPVFYLFVLEIFLTYCYISMERTRDFIKSSRRIANLPVKAMRRIQKVVLAVTVFLLAIFVLPSVLYGQEPLTGITEWKLDLNMGGILMEEQPGEAGPGIEEMLLAYGANEYKEPPKWLTWLLDLLYYVLMTGCFAVVALLIYQFCRRLMRSFEAGQGEDEVILLEEDQDIRITLRRKGRSQDKTNNAKIRRRYRKVILKGSKSKPQGWESPQELEDRYVWESCSDRETAFREIYEKARYSREESSEQELEQFRMIQKGLKKK